MLNQGICRLLLILLLATMVLPTTVGAQDDTVFRIEVDMVLLNVAVTDSKGNYVTGLQPWDFTIYEDGIEQKTATYAEGKQMPRGVGEFTEFKSTPQIIRPSRGRARNRTRDGNGSSLFPERRSEEVASLVTGANVFILFDTSNYMYEGFVYAQDAIADFVRSLDNPDQIALYSYSRDFHRSTTLTPDRGQVLRGLRSTVVGDDAALYNALLLTLKDATQWTGRKVVVVFSNGPDNASMIAPENVREFAQAEGISIYMVSTREARHDPVSTAVFQRISDSTGGKAYFAKDWQEQQNAFTSIREDLAHLYALSYYPSQNPNRGWRNIAIKLAGDHLKNLKVRTRTGYRPRATLLSR